MTLTLLRAQSQDPTLKRCRDRGRAVVHAELGEDVEQVPVFYSISVLDLKIVKWEPGKH